MEAARDRAIQEEIRRAGVLVPLLKDCPTDDPVRIDPLIEPQFLIDGMFVYVVKANPFDVEIKSPTRLTRTQIAERATAHVALVESAKRNA